MSLHLGQTARRLAGLATLGLGAALALAAPAGASEPGPYEDEIGADYGHPRYERRYHEPSPVIERRVVERTYSEHTKIVRPAYGRAVVEAPIYGRPVYGGPVYGRTVYARPAYVQRHDDDEECRVVVKRRVSPWGEVTVRKTRVCEDD